MQALRRTSRLGLCLCLAALLCAGTLASAFFNAPPRTLFAEANEVVDITNMELVDVHESADVCPWIVVAYLSGCGHCRAAAPVVSRLARETFDTGADVLNEVLVAGLNCESDTTTCRALGVRGVPSIFLLVPPNISVADIPLLSPVEINAKDVQENVATSVFMTRVALGEGEHMASHFDTARRIWGKASAGVWEATHKERCAHMRGALRSAKQAGEMDDHVVDQKATATSTPFVEETEFHAVDVANAFFETLYHEVAMVGLKTATSRHALHRFLRTVQQRLPGLGADVVLHALAGGNVTDAVPTDPNDFASISVEDWQHVVLSAGIPFRGQPRDLSWQTCRGSSWRYRGFPCGLWLLYHSLTVNGPRSDAGVVVSDTKDSEVVQVIVDYASYFFSCEACRRHFLRLVPQAKGDPVLQLWAFHNEVNERLVAVKAGNDPQVPKRQFPTREQCPACHKDDAANTFVTEEVAKYLRLRYKWHPAALRTTTDTSTAGPLAPQAGDGVLAITVYRSPLSVNVFLTICVVVVATLLGMLYVLRRARHTGAKRRRPILPLRMQV